MSLFEVTADSEESAEAIWIGHAEDTLDAVEKCGMPAGWIETVIELEGDGDTEGDSE